MNKVISKTIKITSKTMPPTVDFIEDNIKKFNIKPLRWAVVDIKTNDNETDIKELTISVSGEEL